MRPSAPSVWGLQLINSIWGLKLLAYTTAYSFFIFHPLSSKSYNWRYENWKFTSAFSGMTRVTASIPRFGILFWVLYEHASPRLAYVPTLLVCFSSPTSASLWTKLPCCLGGLITLFQLFHTPCKVRKLSSHQTNSTKGSFVHTPLSTTLSLSHFHQSKSSKWNTNSAAARAARYPCQQLLYSVY